MSVVRTCTGTEGIYAHDQYVWSAGGPLDTWATNSNLPHGANQLILLDLNPDSCTIQAITAFENLVINHPNQPCLLARLAKVYVRLQHIYGANTLCSRILEIVGFIADLVFTKWAAIVAKHCASITGQKCSSTEALVCQMSSTQRNCPALKATRSGGICESKRVVDWAELSHVVYGYHGSVFQTC